MTSRILLRGALALSLVGLSGCASFTNLFSVSSENGLSKVDKLLGQVEKVHVESVLSRERMKDALVSLREIVAPGYEGDALTSFALFVDAVNRSELQESRLDDSVGPMQDSADAVFSRWDRNLDSITSESMRRHGKDRMLESKERYDAILNALTPAQTGFALFNTQLRDHVLFLSHDYNASAVAELEKDVGDLLALARNLDIQFQACEDAAQVYVKDTALRGQEQLSRTQARAAPELSRDDAAVASSNR